MEYLVNKNYIVPNHKCKIFQHFEDFSPFKHGAKIHSFVNCISVQFHEISSNFTLKNTMQSQKCKDSDVNSKWLWLHCVEIWNDRTSFIYLQICSPNPFPSCYPNYSLSWSFFPLIISHFWAHSIVLWVNDFFREWQIFSVKNTRQKNSLVLLCWFQIFSWFQ